MKYYKVNSRYTLPVRTARTYGRFFAPVRTRTYGPLKRPVRTGGVYGTPVYVARNVISI